ncbi:hypothetical protein SRB5_12880 [Streptomyces sp. RB5]|uniref:SGNH hydrolase-type esterase domain-containing protein n=1 Tax=Streptomyces smaragdinus TaxID=2585196 RepID=A0A7K0CEI0_9ACTN|nr:SGNH/GDSL hydrolase family protein [Streptomyces smaragdinus]MQY11174.1 hypothetical protein [Streptomyces smaragdinus]
MERTSRFTGPLIAAAVAAVVVVGSATLGGALRSGSGPRQAPVAAVPDSAGHWLHTWASMPQLTEPGNMPPAPFTQPGRVLRDATLRQTVRVTAGGERIRLRFSNAFGGADLPITSVAVALPAGGQAGASAIEEGSSRRVTFGGASSVNVPMGAQMVSDPLPFAVKPGTNLTVTAYLADGQASESITSHPGSRTSSYLLAGDHTLAGDLPGAARADHWYFLSGVEVFAPGHASAVAVLGDSLTDGRGSTTNGNDRWPDLMLDQLQSHGGTADLALLNQAAGGNRVLDDGLGPNVLARLDRDVLSASGVEWLVVFEGVNDIGTAAATPGAQQAVVRELLGAYEQIVVRAHAQGIKVYGATITPFGGNEGYDDAAGLREASRAQVNEWIRHSGVFDAVLDFDEVTRDPANPRQLLPGYDIGDHLHMIPAGYRAVADSVPARLFRP